jgi:two-component system, NtrC family, sensor kinase
LPSAVAPHRSVEPPPAVPLADEDLQVQAPPGRGLQVLLVLAIVLPFVLYGVLGWASWQSTLEETAQRLDRVARAAQEHASKVMDTNEMLVGRVLDLVAPLSDEAIRVQEGSLHRQLVAMTSDLPQLQSIWIVDAAGRPLATNRFYPAPADRLNLADRDFFRWHQSGGQGLFVSEPSIGRITREPYFDTSRRRASADGGFIGLVNASLKPGYFAGFYADLAQAEPGLAVTLFRRDGVLLARHPAAPAGITRSDPDSELMRRVARGDRRGTLTMSSSFDRRDRLVVFRAVERYPVFVGAGIDEQQMLADWQKEMVSLAALLFPICGALVAAAWFALQRSRREHRALERMRGEVEQRLKAEAALLRTQKLQALGQITGSVAHDFNNLLAVVSNSAHLILRRPPGADAQPQAAAIERAVRTGVHLTRQLLAFSRRQALQPEEVDLRESLPRTLELLRTSVSGRIRVELQVAHDLHAVRLDPADLELALLNLVLNAKDAMADGGTVRILAANQEEPDGRRWVVLTVADEGSGIEPSLLERVFEPFFSTKPETNGTGLGLSQVRAACEQAGGTVSIESHLGVGTRVTLRLPAWTGSRGAAQPPAGRVHLDCDILLVEDEPEVADTTRALLEMLGGRVEVAPGAERALALVADASSRPDVVLSDVAMPGALNGLALARRLRGLQPPVPIVLMTGFTGEIDAAHAEGFTVLAKPCEPEVLARALAEACAAGARNRRAG